VKHIDWRRWSTYATVLMALLALGLVAHLLGQFTWAQISSSLAKIHAVQYAGAALCTAASYLTLTGFDLLGVAYAGGRVPYRRVALASFLSLSIGHSVGFAPFSSGTIRYRYYAEAGLDLKQIGLIVALSAVTVALGEATVAGLALLSQPSLSGKLLHLPAGDAIAAGVASLAVPVAYAALAAAWRRPIRIRRWSFRLPSPPIAAGQIGLGLLNYLCVAGALYSVLPSAASIDFQIVAMAYVLGNLAALVTHVPGGLGVLEAVIVVLLPGIDAIGPLIAFRILYYLVPLAVGCLLLAGTELRQRRQGAKPEFAP
jgi:hypothetical protein